VKPFLDALAGGPLLFDGAMGSLLYERGIYLTNSYDELNLSQPALIQRIHRDYLEAGADILETNTFGANRLALARHGHSDHTEQINRGAVALARAVAGDQAYLAGAIGPTGVKFAFAATAERAIAVGALAEQVQLLVGSGVDLLVLETFSDIVELEAAIAVARQTAPGVPVVAQMVFGSEGLVEGGIGPAEVARRLANAGADVVGANCGAGPPELYEVATQMIGCGKPVSIQPNAAEHHRRADHLRCESRAFRCICAAIPQVRGEPHRGLLRDHARPHAKHARSGQDDGG
jgi:homocysteine S-methyltransferase